MFFFFCSEGASFDVGTGYCLVLLEALRDVYQTRLGPCELMELASGVSIGSNCCNR